MESDHLPQQQNHRQPNWCERGCGCPVWYRAGVRGSTRLPTSHCITTFLVALLNLLIYITGAGYNTSVEDKESMVPLVLTSGIIFFIPVLTLIRICWTARNIIPDPDQHLGWAASASGWMMVGRLMCSKCSSEGSRAPALTWYFALPLPHLVPLWEPLSIPTKNYL